MTKAEVTGGWITTCHRENCQGRKRNTGLNGGVSSPSTFAILSETGSAMCVSYASRIGPTTVAFVKSTDDDRLWCAHTMRRSSFRRLCVQQKTKIAWCVPAGLKTTLINFNHTSLLMIF